MLRGIENIMASTDKKLTKSKFKLALECPTKLYYIDKPQYANQQKQAAQRIQRNTGHQQQAGLSYCGLI